MKFIIGAIPQARELLYNPDLWPRNIGIAGFVFRGKPLLAEKKTDNLNQPLSFLEIRNMSPIIRIT